MSSCIWIETPGHMLKNQPKQPLECRQKTHFQLNPVLFFCCANSVVFLLKLCF